VIGELKLCDNTALLIIVVQVLLFAREQYDGKKLFKGVPRGRGY